MQDFPDLILLGKYTNSISQSTVSIIEVDFGSGLAIYNYRDSGYGMTLDFKRMEEYMTWEKWVKAC